MGRRRPVWPANVQLRTWQEEAARQITTAYPELRDFLVVAPPGAGKTRFTMKIAYELFELGIVERMVVVVPNLAVQWQWRDTARQFGFDLSATWKNGRQPEPGDYHGIVVTYQQVAAKPAFYADHCRRPTLVVFDEIHHVGDQRTWGRAVQQAFGNAAFRLGLSGTPFRSDNHPIPFVRYDDQGQCVPDYDYALINALDDGILRELVFRSFDGDMVWDSEGERITATFHDQLSQKRADERRRVAVAPGGWLKEVIKEGDKLLTEICTDPDDPCPDAGGLIITSGVEAARYAAGVVRDITGEEPALAISHDGEGAAQIEAFKAGRQRWIITIKMVSEGVDIPRLRVGIYASTITTPLFFIQAYGRLVRIQKEGELAYMLIPRDPVLVDLAEEVLRQQHHRLEHEVEKLDSLLQELHTAAEEERTRPQRKLIPISSSARPDDTIYQGRVIRRPWLEEAEQILREQNITNSLKVEPYALVLEAFAAKRGMTGVVIPEQPNPPSLDERRKAISARINQLAGRLARMQRLSSKGAQEIHRRWIEQGNSPQKDATINELEQKLRWVTDLVAQQKKEWLR